jgi:hypothetical protein
VPLTTAAAAATETALRTSSRSSICICSPVVAAAVIRPAVWRSRRSHSCSRLLAHRQAEKEMLLVGEQRSPLEEQREVEEHGREGRRSVWAFG